MDTATLIRTLTIQYRYTTYSFGVNLEGVSDEEALRQPPQGGNCLNWVAGHVVGSRAGTLRVLGQEVPFDDSRYDRYQRGSDPVTGSENTVSLAEMRSDFAATADGLAAGLNALTVDYLALKAPFSPGGRQDETMATLLPGLVFHESYHIGQLGVLRRWAGKEGAIR